MGEILKDFYKCIKELDECTYLENYLKYTLSPVIHGVKPSITITLTSHRNLIDKWDKHGEHILRKLGLRWVVLRKTQIGSIVLIYNVALVEKVLGCAQIKAFLSKIGYESLDVEDAIAYLALRYKQHHCPHELGIFLGIPLEDVKDFMDCNKKECLFCGYWKVYNNLGYALETFKAYDKAKKEMLYELIEELQVA